MTEAKERDETYLETLKEEMNDVLADRQAQLFEHKKQISSFEETISELETTVMILSFFFFLKQERTMY